MNKKEFREAQKRLVVVRDRVIEIDARFVELKSAVESEKRKMNEKESAEFANLVEEKRTLLQERDVLRIGIEGFKSGALPSEKEENLRADFARLVCLVRDRREIPEELRGMVDKNEIVIPLSRAGATITDTSSVAPVVPITVGDLLMPLNNGIVYNKLGLKIQTFQFHRGTIKTIRCLNNFSLVFSFNSIEVRLRHYPCDF